MTAAERSSRATVLEKVLGTLNAIHGSSLPPGTWDQFEEAVAAILAALDDDEGHVVVNQKRQHIEKLDSRQQNVAGPSEDEPVKQPPRARSASDNLSRRIKEELDDDRGRR
ncbi:hypothetical protein [Actinoplanes sp. ATCC 53533]|uniref:hypothetical protein n=1 Tax=Actinoplanes sp. ATCC 53533 TaxID=1288362 RepID=UPI000F76CD71|nr:hypothetical protein [Actinoplanes sp. ATCC 53533]